MEIWKIKLEVWKKFRNLEKCFWKLGNNLGIWKTKLKFWKNLEILERIENLENKNWKSEKKLRFENNLNRTWNWNFNESKLLSWYLSTPTSRLDLWAPRRFLAPTRGHFWVKDHFKTCFRTSWHRLTAFVLDILIYLASL